MSIPASAVVGHLGATLTADYWRPATMTVSVEMAHATISLGGHELWFAMTASGIFIV